MKNMREDAADVDMLNKNSSLNEVHSSMEETKTHDTLS